MIPLSTGVCRRNGSQPAHVVNNSPAFRNVGFHGPLFTWAFGDVVHSSLAFNEHARICVRRWYAGSIVAPLIRNERD